MSEFYLLVLTIHPDGLSFIDDLLMLLNRLETGMSPTWLWFI